MSRSQRCRVVGATVALSSLFVAASASAQVGTDTYGTPRRGFESPQRFVLEARFGAFWPAVDTDPALTSGSKPFASIYGTGPQLLGGAEFDWEAVRIPHLGTIGPGLGAAYMKATAKAKFAAIHNGETTSGEDTSLEDIPFYAVAALRVDVLWREFHVPLVPWVKVGLGYALWRASNTGGTSSYNGVVGEGHSIGTHLGFGLGLNLNFLDPDTAREFDNSLGVNGTYLFTEYTREDLDGLGFQSDPLRVGGDEWTFGLAMEF